MLTWRRPMVLLIVLLQMVPFSPDTPTITSSQGNIPELHKTWEKLNLRCRTLPPESPEGEGACSRRDVLGSQLGELGWCVRYLGLQITWEMCARSGLRLLDAR